jgi:cytochrome P450
MNAAAVASPIPAHVPPHLVVDFDVYNPEGVGDDYHAPFRRLFEQKAPDLFWTPRYGGHWVLRRTDDLWEVFKDHERFSSHMQIVPREFNPPADRRVLPIQADPPEHTVFRAMIAPAFSPAAVARREEEVRALTIALIEGFKPRGECEIVADLAQHLPIKVFMGMVGLPESDRLMLLDLVGRMFEGGEHEKYEVILGIQRYLAPVVEARKLKPGQDLISQIVQQRVGERAITVDEVLRLCTVLMLGGLDTVASMIGFVMHFLATHPGHRRQLIAEPGLIPTATEELLRRFAMTNPGRVVARDCEFHGVSLRQGDMVILATPSGAIDPGKFEQADVVDFTRKLPMNTTFGNGPHRCPGSYLARVELKVLLQEWLPRIADFRLKAGDPPQVRTGINGRFARLALEWTV